MPSQKPITRKIKTHRKSRQGCGNCKLRSVKCDENKPGCKRCIAYGVLCNYDRKHSALQISANGTFNIETLHLSYSLNKTIPFVDLPFSKQVFFRSGKSDTSYQLLETDHLGLLNRFQTRTVFTISVGEGLVIYQNEIIKLACLHPFLMHAVLALTLMHDRYLSPTLNTKLSTTEAFHWYQTTVLFNSKLSSSVLHSERDALWATSVFLGIITLAQIDARVPEEAWPLKPSGPLDLNWLKMTEGKNAVLKISDPLRVDSVFRPMLLENNSFLHASPTVVDLDSLPAGFAKLYGLNTTSTIENNPYHGTAAILSHSLNSDSMIATMMGFLSVISNMRPDYTQLVKRKDPRALLLLAFWYAKVCQFKLWWVLRRAALECQAICIYLRKYHGGESKIQDLLQFPQRMLDSCL